MRAKARSDSSLPGGVGLGRGTAGAGHENGEHDARGEDAGDAGRVADGMGISRSGRLEAVPDERQRADAPAGQREERIAERRRHERACRARRCRRAAPCSGTMCTSTRGMASMRSTG